MPRKRRVPAYRLHKRSGQAVVTLTDTNTGRRRDIYLGEQADYNGNGEVDAADYTIWADNFGSTTNLAADGNGDGVIDAANYTVWADTFGGVHRVMTIPEPASINIIVGGCMWFASRRRSVGQVRI